MRQAQQLSGQVADPDREMAVTLAGAPEHVSQTSTDRLLVKLARNRDLVLLAIAAALFALFSLTTTTFLREFNLFNILRSISLISIVAVGMTYTKVHRSEPMRYLACECAKTT